jgi:hypothetical protein
MLKKDIKNVLVYSFGEPVTRIMTQESPHFESGPISRLFNPHSARTEGQKGRL